MARPQKHNADYFPHRNDLRNDRRCKALRSKFGLEGYAVFTMLLEILIGSNHFQIKDDKMEIELIAGDIDINSKALHGIINYLVQLGLLEKSEGIITSPVLNELKKILEEARTSDRKRKSENTSKENDIKENGVFQPENDVFHLENTQSKVKESKEKEIKVNKGVIEPPPVLKNFDSLRQDTQAETAKEKNCAKKESEACRDIFLKQAPKYYWEAKDDEHLNGLLQKIRATNPNTGTINGFQQLILALPPYWRSKKFTIQNLNVNFNEIMNEIQAKKPAVKVYTSSIHPTYVHHVGSKQAINVSKTPELSPEQKQEVQQNLINRVCEEYQNYCTTGNFNIWPIRLVYDLFARQKILQFSEDQLKEYETRAIEQRKQELKKPLSREDKFRFKTILESYANGIDISEQNKIEKIKIELAVVDFLKQCKEKNTNLKNLFHEK